MPATATLSLARYRVAFEALEPLDLPAYLGSTLRGAFGHAFRVLCCPARPGEECPIPATCPYHVVFETAPPPDATALRTHDEVPRPFVIAPPPAGPREYPAGAEVLFDLTLIGRARELFPHFVVTLREVDRMGRRRRAVVLRRIDAVDLRTGAAEIAYADDLVRRHDLGLTLDECATTEPPGRAVRVRFVTQTRLKHDDRFVKRLEFHVIFRRLLGRLSSLARFHCASELDVEFRGLIEQAAQIRLIEDRTRWTTWTRYSARQDRTMDWSGLVGTATYEGDLSSFWPYLVFGQWTHVGKGATFGLGGYRLEAVDGPGSPEV